MVERSPQESSRYKVVCAQLQILMAEHFFQYDTIRETPGSVLEDMSGSWARLVSQSGETLTREVIAVNALVRGYATLAPDQRAATCVAEDFTVEGDFASYKRGLDGELPSVSDEEYYRAFYMDGIRISLGEKKVDGLAQLSGGTVTIRLPEGGPL